MLAFVPRTYAFTVTQELDTDYLKYLRRRLSPLNAPESTPPPESTRLDISLDDPDGDVVGGLAAWTAGDSLMIDLLWVDSSLRGQGIGRQLIGMAEGIAQQRGCNIARIAYAPRIEFYQKLGYSVSARLVQYPIGGAFYQMHKTLCQPCLCDLNQHHQNRIVIA